MAAAYGEKEPLVCTPISLALALPFLPVAKIEDGMQEVTAAIQERQDDHGALIPFLEYLSRQWMGIVGAATISIHRQSRRTNNAVE